MQENARSVYGKIVLHHEPVTIGGTIVGYDTMGEERPLVTAVELMLLPAHKQDIGYITRFLESRIAHYTGFERWQQPGRDIRAIGEEFAEHEQYGVSLGDGLTLKLRRKPGLVLLGARKPEEKPRVLLRLDSMLEYDHHYLPIKSGDMDEERAEEIVLGMLHLRKLYDGKYGLLFLSPKARKVKTTSLDHDLRRYGIPLFHQKLDETQGMLERAARHAKERLDQDIKNARFGAEEIISALRLVS